MGDNRMEESIVRYSTFRGLFCKMIFQLLDLMIIKQLVNILGSLYENKSKKINKRYIIFILYPSNLLTTDKIVEVCMFFIRYFHKILSL